MYGSVLITIYFKTPTARQRWSGAHFTNDFPNVIQIDGNVDSM